MPSERSVSFTEDSQPYLWATEYPWLGLDPTEIIGKRVLTIAGGGDLPIFFQAAGAGAVQAIDVSRRACQVNELKRAALQCLPWESFVWFFCSGLKAATAWLQRLGLTRVLTAAERLAIYQRLAPSISEAARAFWGPMLEAATGTTNPFAALLRATDLLCPNALPPLSSAADYQGWRQAAGGYALSQCSLDEFLASSSQSFDFIYCSNVLDYLRRDLVMNHGVDACRAAFQRLLDQVEKSLAPAGTLACYVFAAPESAALTAFIADFGDLDRRGYRLQRIPIQCRSQLFQGTRLRHTLLLRKRRQAGTGDGSYTG